MAEAGIPTRIGRCFDAMCKGWGRYGVREVYAGGRDIPVRGHLGFEQCYTWVDSAIIIL